jgi:DNA-binding NarL/FixJ family response regulator
MQVPDMGESIRVLVVDESLALSQGLELHLPVTGPVQVLGPVPDARAALGVLRRETIHIVLVDLDRADRSGTDMVRQICEATDGMKVLGVSEQKGPELAASALAAGACGVVSPHRNGEPMLSTLRRAMAGELVLPAVHLTSLVDRVRDSRHEPSGTARVSALTDREKEILAALADGSGTTEIAGSLGISPMTVQSHVKNILAKLGVHSKVEAVTLALRYGLRAASRSA